MSRTKPTLGPAAAPCIHEDIFLFQDRVPQQIAAMARALVSLIDRRDNYTGSHCARVAAYVRRIATQLDLPDEEKETIEFAASVHDIGKAGISDDILLKPDKLTKEELAWMQKYPEWGWTTLHQVKGLQKAALLVLHQHERIDGGGYPKGLRGDEIPLGSRIIAVADSYDALTVNRPYRKALTQAAALDELMRCSGTQFDPEVVNALRVIVQE